MWEWFVDKSVWVLIVSAVLVILLLFFNDKVRDVLTGMFKEENREKARRNINIVFWVLEGIFTVIMILSFIGMTFSGDSTAPIVTGEEVKRWVLDSGVAIIIILLVGIALWLALKNLLPPLVNRFMARPVPGESREGLKKRADTLLRVFIGLARVVIVLVVVLMVLSELGVAIAPLLAGLGVVGIAVGFGAQYLIRDLIAGVFILMENQYRIGDVAKIADITGLVEEINLRKTVLRDLDGVVHHIPNGEIRIASNFSRHFSRVNLNVSVAYNTDLDHAIDVINNVCKQMAEEERWRKVVRKVPSVLRVDKLGDSGIEIKITGDVKPSEQWNVMGELRLRLKRTFDKEGIEIPYPHVKVFFGNKPGDSK